MCTTMLSPHLLPSGPGQDLDASSAHPREAYMSLVAQEAESRIEK